jgi:hypothetical protein
MTSNQRFGVLLWMLVATIAAGLMVWLTRDSQWNGGKNGSGQRQAVSYKVLDDDMGTIIRIGVESQITEHQLRATMVKAADEHQDDRARDYLFSRFLWVETYLLRDGRRSSIPAGRLRRYVPARNPPEKKSISTERGKLDRFTATLNEARWTLQ